MLTHHRKPVCLSLISTDLPVLSVVETSATLYQKDCDRFHLLLTAPSPSCEPTPPPPIKLSNSFGPRILWLEISPYRVIMTMQGNGQLCYRHFWEQGIYGVSRYWLPTESIQPHEPIRLRNFTRSLSLNGHPLPEHLRVEYELWTGKIQLGSYVLSLEIEK
ncbi:hypothetical protein [Calothrix sp. NIES-3974]|uniref:hypothetical protein n=1 Tax=Calothrix sp. NIES-3974 TaxID=2005462 RepID=UPI000B60D355|nr:hypothetical protein [Calothrix sp. NIES-3974]BAZ04574.1 hypothetical protein NIES3974_12140 [Calothrix sp. NIES-3974]